jgi:mono/diheme cytochrome c family protein
LGLHRLGKAEILVVELEAGAGVRSRGLRPDDGGSIGNEGDGMGKWMNGRPLRSALLGLACLLAALAVVALAAGCGNSGNADSGSTASTVTSARRVVKVQPVKQDRWTYARARFREMCAGCHTLADAGTTGRRYNLDASSVSGVSETHVRYAIAEGEPGMPAWRAALSEREYEELVAYVVAVTRKEEANDYWGDQLRLRGEAANWSRAKTRRLEAYARRLRRE